MKAIKMDVPDAHSAHATSTRQVLSRITLITLSMFIVFASIIELFLRRIIPAGTSLDGASAEVLLNSGPIERLSLSINPLYVTDRNGLFVANHALQPGRVNADGYRSPPFDQPDDGRTSLMFLGDSFTWGDSADPLDKSYPDLVRAAGFRVHNLGIGGVGVRQYRAEAEIYIPRIKPDVVCVMFYPANDFEYEPPIIAGRPRYYATNRVLLSALTNAGEPIPFETAASEFLGRFGTGVVPSLRRLAEHSYLYRVANTLMSDEPSFELRTQVALEELRAARAAAQAGGAKFLLFILRVREGSGSEEASTENAAALLAELNPIIVPVLDESCYPPRPQYHYNNKGHAEVAKFVLTELSRLGYEPANIPDPSQNSTIRIDSEASVSIGAAPVTQ